MKRALLLGLVLLGAAAATARAADPSATAAPPVPSAARRGDGLAVATFAGGCFWCVEDAFEEVPGVRSVESGYTGGSVRRPSYEQVTQGTTGHYEAVQVLFDPARVPYEKLLDVFWRNIDPTDATGQFCDKGPQYRSVIFWHDDAQRAAAERSKQALEESGGLPGRIATAILPAGEFYVAEDYHQDYARRNPLRYHFYRRGCGRDARLEELWQKSMPTTGE